MVENSEWSPPEDNLHLFSEERKDTLCKKILRFFLSFVGLFVLLAAYVVGGAYYFHLQEKPHEDLRKATMFAKAQDIDDALEYIVERMSYITNDEHGSINNCTTLTNDEFYVSDRVLYAEVCLDWNDPRVLASSFCQCLKSLKEVYMKEASDNIHQLITFIITAAKEDKYSLHPDTGEPLWEWKWTFTNSLLFAMTTLTLIGYGHVSPSTEALQVQVLFYTILGLPLMMMFLANIGQLMAKAIIYVYSRICCKWCRVRRHVSVKEDGTLKPEMDQYPFEGYNPSHEILVPVTITICVMAAYVIFGAAIFMQWEDDWNLVDGCYFTFVTLTTIGFGDLVPGSLSFLSKESDTSLVLKLLFTTFYCLLGLAVIAMGIDIFRSHMKAKTKWIREGIEYENMQMYIMTLHPDAKETPKDKTGLRLKFGQKNKKKQGIQDFDDTCLCSDVE